MNAADLPSVEASDAATAGTDGTVLLDVREYDEWMVGHAPAATHLAMTTFPDHVDELDRSARYVVVCRSGNRSARVVAWMRANGFDATNLTAGMSAWVRAGLPVVNQNGNSGLII